MKRRLRKPLTAAQKYRALEKRKERARLANDAIAERDLRRQMLEQNGCDPLDCDTWEGL